MSGNIKNIMAAIDYIESHLHEKLDLETVAGLYIIQNIICTECSQRR